MSIIKYLAFVVTLAFLIASGAAFADEGSPSYTMKKQGRVPFSNSDQAQTETIEDASSDVTPSEIEPAAGASDESAPADKKENSLSEQLKLPRKN